jgi:hypothetical protein
VQESYQQQSVCLVDAHTGASGEIETHVARPPVSCNAATISSQPCGVLDKATLPAGVFGLDSFCTLASCQSMKQQMAASAIRPSRVQVRPC